MIRNPIPITTMWIQLEMAWAAAVATMKGLDRWQLIFCVIFVFSITAIRSYNDLTMIIIFNVGFKMTLMIYATYHYRRAKPTVKRVFRPVADEYHYVKKANHRHGFNASPITCL